MGFFNKYKFFQMRGLVFFFVQKRIFCCNKSSKKE